jgi:hypothetical protein
VRIVWGRSYDCIYLLFFETFRIQLLELTTNDMDPVLVCLGQRNIQLHVFVVFEYI